MNLYDSYDDMLEDIFYKYVFCKVNIEHDYTATMYYIDVDSNNDNNNI